MPKAATQYTSNGDLWNVSFHKNTKSDFRNYTILKCNFALYTLAIPSGWFQLAKTRPLVNYDVSLSGVCLSAIKCHILSLNNLD